MERILHTVYPEIIKFLDQQSVLNCRSTSQIIRDMSYKFGFIRSITINENLTDFQKNYLATRNYEKLVYRYILLNAYLPAFDFTATELHLTSSRVHIRYPELVKKMVLTGDDFGYINPRRFVNLEVLKIYYTKITDFQWDFTGLSKIKELYVFGARYMYRTHISQINNFKNLEVLVTNCCVPYMNLVSEKVRIVVTAGIDDSFSVSNIQNLVLSSNCHDILLKKDTTIPIKSEYIWSRLPKKFVNIYCRVVCGFQNLFEHIHGIEFWTSQNTTVQSQNNRFLIDYDVLDQEMSIISF